MPGQSFFVKLNDSLRALGVGLFSGNQISFVRSLPFDQEHQFTRRVGGANDTLWLQVPIETPDDIVIAEGGINGHRAVGEVMNDAEIVARLVVDIAK